VSPHLDDHRLAGQFVQALLELDGIAVVAIGARSRGRAPILNGSYLSSPLAVWDMPMMVIAKIEAPFEAPGVAAFPRPCADDDRDRFPGRAIRRRATRRTMAGP